MQKRYIGVVVAVVAFLALFPTASNIFDYDDIELVRDNPWIQKLSGLSYMFSGKMFTEVWGDRIYRPILMASLYLNQLFLGHQAWAYHLVNLILHAFASYLLYRLLCRYSHRSFQNACAAILFALHPIHVDAVAFIVGRSDILACIFLLLAWQTSNVVLSAALFACAFLSKEAAAFIVVLAPLLFWLARPLGFETHRSGLREKALCIWAAFVFYILLRWRILGSLGSAPEDSFFPDRSLSILIPTVARIFKDYVQLLFIPWNLRVDYSDYSIRSSFLEPEALASYALHMGLIFFAWKSRKKQFSLTLSILGFYVSLLPVSHLIPFRDIFAERFLYIPCAFFALGLAGALARIANRRIRTLVTVGTLLFFGATAFTYSLTFRSRTLLWQSMTERGPANPKFRYNAGVAFFEDGNCDEATVQLSEALRLKPDYARAYRPLGKCFLMDGKTDQARDAFERAVRLAPLDPATHEDLAVFHYFNGDVRISREEMERAIDLAPGRARSKKLLDMIRAKSGPP